MTKAELLKALEPYPDDAILDICPNDYCDFNFDTASLVYYSDSKIISFIAK